MTHLLLCDSSVVNVNPPSSSAGGSSTSKKREQERQTKWNYCTSGAYNDLDLCTSVPFLSTRNDTTSSMGGGSTREFSVDSTYHESIHQVGTRTTKQIIYFFVANCEVFGTTMGGTRYKEACSLEEEIEKHEFSSTSNTARLSNTDTGTNTDPQDHQHDYQQAQKTNTTGGVSSPCRHMSPRQIALNIDVKYHNPNGFLSFTELPFISIYAVFVPLWFVVVLCWESNIFRYARRSHIVTLQKKMAMVPVLRFCAVIITMILWLHRNNGEDSDFLLLCLILLQVVYRCVLAEVMLLISKGWQITRPNLHVMEERNIRGLLMMYTFAWSLYYLSSEPMTPSNGAPSEEGSTPDGRAVQVAFIGVIVLTIMFVAVLYSVWYSVTMQLNVLSYQINLIRAYNINPRTTPVWIKFHMLRRFRQAFALYLMLSAVTDIMVTTAKGASWAPALMDEVLEILCCVVVGWTFRARDFSPYFERVRRATLDTSRDGDALAAGASAAAAAAGDDDEQLRRDNAMNEWRHGMSLPEAPEHMFHPSRSSIVVFVNPNGRRASLGSTNVVGVTTPTSPGTFVIKEVEMEVEMEEGAKVSQENDAVDGGSGEVPMAEDNNHVVTTCVLPIPDR